MSASSPSDVEVVAGDPLPTGPLLRNSARCLRCAEEVVSAHRHDFRSCRCGALAVDGGLDYLRRAWDGSLGDPKDVFVDTSVCLHDFTTLEVDPSSPGLLAPALRRVPSGLCRVCGAKAGPLDLAALDL